MSRLPIRAAALAAAAARASYAGLRQRPPGGAATWSRTNHRGEPVTLLEGPAVAAGAVAGALAAPGLTARGRAALAVAGAGAAALGCYDDLAGSGSSRGFRGHLGALRRGELTTGAVKIAGIGATGVAASVLLGAAGAGRGRDRGRAPAALAAADLAINAGLIAGGANLLNLFDLRPGRAIKVTLGAGTLLAASSPAGRAAVAAPLGAAAALLGRGSRRAGHARRRRRQRPRRHARHRGRGGAAAPRPRRDPGRHHRADRRQRGRQLHQGHSEAPRR